MIELVNITSKHRDSLVRILKNENVEKWLVNVPSGYTIEDADNFIEWCKEISNNPDSYIFAIEHDGIHVGGIGIRRVEVGIGEIGYYIEEAHWRKGFATEAIMKILDLAREEMNIDFAEAYILEGNEASELLLLKCGFDCKGWSRLYSKNGKQFRSKRFAIEMKRPNQN